MDDKSMSGIEKEFLSNKAEDVGCCCFCKEDAADHDADGANPATSWQSAAQNKKMERFFIMVRKVLEEAVLVW